MVRRIACAIGCTVAAAVVPLRTQAGRAPAIAPEIAQSTCPAPAQSAFGSTQKTDVSMEGKIYFLPKTPENGGLTRLKDFDGIPSQGSVYTDRFDIPDRSFTEGFPGVTDRYEWFSLDYQGSIYVPVAGAYTFRLSSDDGSMLYLDDALVVDNDGVHGMLDRSATATLTQGDHAFRLRYFQGPATFIGLQVFVTPPGGKERIFLLQDFDKNVLESRKRLGVTEDASGIHVRLGAEVLFDTAKYVLRPEATASMQEVVTVLKGNPGHPITIEGHTDNVGGAKANQTLSEQRANAVKQWLIGTGGIPDGCIGTKGFGATKPVASNATAAGRQKNRRVEISIAKGAGQ
jgi:outer membrane protein OmpA-like peptidoglycan-associated protein